LPSDYGVAVVRSVNLLKIAAAAEVLRYRCVAVRQGSSVASRLALRFAAIARTEASCTCQVPPSSHAATPPSTSTASTNSKGYGAQMRHGVRAIGRYCASVAEECSRPGQGQQGKVPRVRHRATAAEPARLALGTLGVDLTASKPNGTAMMRLMPSRMSVVSFYR